MIVFPNSKLNLGLNILRKRKDGYHDLETVFYPLPLTDILEITPYPGRTHSIPLSVSGLEIDGDIASNLCVKAYRLLKKDIAALSHIQMHLHKVIPSGAGLGGGSSDAAFTLNLLNKQFDLKLSREKLLQYSVQLGSDCPFFIINKPCFAKGRGEILEEINISLANHKILIINPPIHIGTGLAFQEILPTIPVESIKTLVMKPITTWKDNLRNDFEATVFKRFPMLLDIKNKLYENGAIYASMTGSGSTLFGIFEEKAKIDLAFPPDYFVKELICHS